MPNIYTNLSGLHGRRVGVSATGAIVDREGYGAAMIDSSGVRVTPMRSFTEGISSSGTVMKSSGVTFFASGTATAQNFNLYAPSSGQDKEIFALCSATTVIVETSVSGVNFVTTGGESTKITFSVGGGVKGERVILRGLSTTRWAIMSKTAGVS